MRSCKGLVLIGVLFWVGCQSEVRVPASEVEPERVEPQFEIVKGDPEEREEEQLERQLARTKRLEKVTQVLQPVDEYELYRHNSKYQDLVSVKEVFKHKIPERVYAEKPFEQSKLFEIAKAGQGVKGWPKLKAFKKNYERGVPGSMMISCQDVRVKVGHEPHKGDVDALMFVRNAAGEMRVLMDASEEIHELIKPDRLFRPPMNPDITKRLTFVSSTPTQNGKKLRIECTMGRISVQKLLNSEVFSAQVYAQTLLDKTSKVFTPLDEEKQQKHRRRLRFIAVDEELPLKDVKWMIANNVRVSKMASYKLNVWGRSTRGMKMPAKLKTKFLRHHVPENHHEFREYRRISSHRRGWKSSRTNRGMGWAKKRSSYRLRTAERYNIKLLPHCNVQGQYSCFLRSYEKASFWHPSGRDFEQQVSSKQKGTISSKVSLSAYSLGMMLHQPWEKDASKSVYMSLPERTIPELVRGIDFADKLDDAWPLFPNEDTYNAPGSFRDELDNLLEQHALNDWDAYRLSAALLYAEVPTPYRRAEDFTFSIEEAERHYLHPLAIDLVKKHIKHTALKGRKSKPANLIKDLRNRRRERTRKLREK